MGGIFESCNEWNASRYGIGSPFSYTKYKSLTEFYRNCSLKAFLSNLLIKTGSSVLAQYLVRKLTFGSSLARLSFISAAGRFYDPSPGVLIKRNTVNCEVSWFRSETLERTQFPYFAPIKPCTIQIGATHPQPLLFPQNSTLPNLYPSGLPEIQILDHIGFRSFGSDLINRVSISFAIETRRYLSNPLSCIFYHAILISVYDFTFTPFLIQF